MYNKLNLNKIYSNFNSYEIENDISKIKILLDKLKSFSKNLESVFILEQFLYLSNNTCILLDKLYSFARLNLYLDTKNSAASSLLKKIENLDFNFKEIQQSFFKFLSVEKIEEYSTLSSYVLQHKYYLNKQLKKASSTSNSTYDQEYQKSISKNKIIINDKKYPINLTIYDFIVNSELEKIQLNYFSLRNKLLDEYKSYYSTIFYNIKKETINLSKRLNFSSSLDMSLSDVDITSQMLNNILSVTQKNQEIFNKIFSTNYNEFLNNISYSLSDAQNIIINSFQEFDPNLAALVKNMFLKQHLNLEDSDTKIIGSCHLKILTLKESRIVGHFSGNIKDLFQLAHEFGHAYQNNLIMNCQTPLNSNVPTSICEIISIFCELLLLDYLLKNTNNNSEKKSLLLYFLIYSMQAILDVYSRFNFENDIFSLIEKEGKAITSKDLDSIMLKNQKNIYNKMDMFYDKYQWIYKPHYYFADSPYYNYPYLLGILYALLLFNKYKNSDKNIFLNSFYDFCYSSACSNIEDLSKKFNIDLSDKLCFDAAFLELENLINQLLSK